jgi:small subunit ribosomal protein S11
MIIKNMNDKEKQTNSKNDKEKQIDNKQKQIKKDIKKTTKDNITIKKTTTKHSKTENTLSNVNKTKTKNSTINTNNNQKKILNSELSIVYNKYINSNTKKTIKKYKNSNILSVYVFSSFNNITASLINENNETIYFGSAGKLGFKNTQKSSPYASETLAKLISSIILTMNKNECKIFLTGPGYNKKNFVVWLMKYIEKIIFIEERVKYVFNGVRPKNPRKV